ncbi:MAG: Na+/H+ antiporter NhaA [Cyclobacteriaceae bacterium]|nr:Na+/H+ antiporter NhaA [Cyclobacteriaceae bacterium]
MAAERIDKFLRPFQRFIHEESSSGVVLLVCTAAAVILSNSPLSGAYHRFWELEFSIRLAGYEVSESLHDWINDGLMAMFFFFVGLEMKREMIGGELSNLRNALLPLAAALGGMVLPAIIYVAINYHSPGEGGWGIPMATDIAFALAVLSLLGKRVPNAARIFLTTLAIADDLGAVLVIAIKYSSDISLDNLAIGAGFMAVLLTANYLGVRNTTLYGIVGIGGLWLAFLLSGVHATVAGVLAALAIPARTKINEVSFTAQLRGYVREFESIKPNDVSILEPDQVDAIEKIKSLTRSADTPLQRLEHALRPIALFVVMPIFALANAGISLQDISADDLMTPVTLGVFFGLVLGKTFGIFGMSWLFVKLKWATLPKDVNFRTIFGLGMVGGIGFTMSLFITTLAFGTSSDYLIDSKIGILAASIVSGVCGYMFLRRKS